MDGEAVFETSAPGDLAPGDPQAVAGRGAVKVAFLTQWFTPDATNTPLWIASALRRQGLDVNVVTGVPNYPAGKTYPGYSAWRQRREVVDGFDVIRVPAYPSHGGSAIGRIANLASYAASSSMIGKSFLKPADVALVYSSPATAAVAAMRAHKRWGLPYVLFILDMWPDSVFASGFLTGGPARRVAEKGLGWFTHKAYEGAAHIAVTSPSMAQLLFSRGVPAEKVSTIYNWADEQTMRPVDADHTLRTALGLGSSFLLMYAGNHGTAQRLDNAIHAMAQLTDLPDVHLLLVGDGSVKRSLQELAADLKLPNVHFADRVGADRVPGLVASADMQLVSLADRDLFRMTMPSKMQSLMACAQPILLSAAGDAADALERAGAGIISAPDNPGELAAAIRRARATPKADLRAMGRSGHEFYCSSMSEAVNSHALAQVLRAAAGVTDPQ
jgi:glycosyltransferase involved in cell wall biosynthesis